MIPTSSGKAMLFASPTTTTLQAQGARVPSDRAEGVAAAAFADVQASFMISRTSTMPFGGARSISSTTRIVTGSTVKALVVARLLSYRRRAASLVKWDITTRRAAVSPPGP